MEAILFIILQIFFATRAVLKIGNILPREIGNIFPRFSTEGFLDGYGDLDREGTGDTRLLPCESPRK